MRAVTFEGTQCNRSAARAMLPTFATVLNIRSWESSIFNLSEFAKQYKSIVLTDIHRRQSECCNE